MAKIVVVVPAYNEAENLPALLENLYYQYRQSGAGLLPRTEYSVLIVDNGSTDASRAICAAFKEEYPDFGLEVVSEPVKGVVPCRITGFRHAAKANPEAAYLAAGDADTRFHPRWLASALHAFDTTEAELLSFPGGFPSRFWERVPALFGRYLGEVGTIMFDITTLSLFGIQAADGPFSHEVFHRFGRRLTDACFAVRAASYFASGGITREFGTEDGGREIFSEGWRMSFRFEMRGSPAQCIMDRPFETSPRRMLGAPWDFFRSKSYSDGMADHRARHGTNAYRALDGIAELIDFHWTRRYVVENYIVLSCITRPELAEQNAGYLGTRCAGELLDGIRAWRLERRQATGAEILAFAKRLTAKCYPKVFDGALASLDMNRDLTIN